MTLFAENKNTQRFNSLAAKLFSAVFMRISFYTYSKRNSSHTHAYCILIYSAAISEYYSSKINVIIHIIINTVDIEKLHILQLSVQNSIKYTMIAKNT